MTHLMILRPLLGVPGSAAPAAIAQALITDQVRRLRSIRQHVRTWRTEIATVMENLKRDVDTFRTAPEVPFWDNLDELIDFAERLEQALGADHANICRLADELMAHAKSSSPAARPILEDIARTTVNTHADYVEALRDARWELVVRRTEREPPPVPGPPEHFDFYLGRLQGA